MSLDYSVASYLRISNEDKYKKDESNSIINQRNLIKDFINKDNELRSYNFIEYVDDGCSGFDFKRPGINKLFEDIKKNKVNCIIVKDLSRFGRNYIEVSNYLENIFPYLNIRFIAINDNFDSKKSKYNLNDIDINFKNIIYDYYSKDLSKKVTISRNIKAKQGKYVGSVAPFGYKKSSYDVGILEIDEESSKVVKDIFSLFLSGKNYLEIANILNDLNILTRREFSKNKKQNNLTKKNIWKSEMIKDILTNKTYIGTLEYLKSSKSIKTRRKFVRNSKENWIVVEDAYPSIISKEDFFKVQTLLKKKNSKKEIKRKNIFAYKLYCGYCKYSIFNSSKKYFCQNIKYNYFDECNKNIILKEKLENIVFSLIKKKIYKFKQENKNNIENEKNLYKIRLDNIESEKTRIYMLYLDEKITKEQYINKKKNLENEQKNIYLNLEKLNNKNENYINLAHINKFINVETLNYDLVDFFIEKIYLYDSNKVEIDWKF
ncbi:recombinase family protein [[Clostridium] colinum]|uniref:recombinase family protein n=1 Tax=[Clostridium] colinum TaxID=36835 RepID=UPI002024C8EE|nr:recombinase family protein [[Clostridium] colinum]